MAPRCEQLAAGFQALAQHAGRQALHRHRRSLEPAEEQHEIDNERLLLVLQQSEAHVECLEQEAGWLEVSIANNERTLDAARDLRDQHRLQTIRQARLVVRDIPAGGDCAGWGLEAGPAGEVQVSEDTVDSSLGWSEFCDGLDDALRLTVTGRTNQWCYNGPKMVAVRGGKYSLAQLGAGVSAGVWSDHPTLNPQPFLIPKS